MRKITLVISALSCASMFMKADVIIPTWDYPMCQPWWEWTQGGSVSYGDYDNDGWLDMLLTSNNNTTLLKGDGGWWAGKTVHGETGGYDELRGLRYGSSAWLDYNNDGFLDFIVVGNSDGNNTRENAVIQLYKNNQGTSFTKDEANTSVLSGAAVWNNSGDDCSRNHFAIADFNNDGWIDIVVNGQGSNGNRILELYINNEGTFEKAGYEFTGIDGNTVWTADFNNDGFMDIAVSGYSSADGIGFCTYVYYGNGDATFTEVCLPYGMQNGTLLGMDVNNDGWQDILVGGYTYIDGEWLSEMVLYLNDGNGEFTVLRKNEIGVGNWNRHWGHMACGDLNNDGYMDFVFATNWNPDGSADGCSMKIVLNNGDNTFTAYPADRNARVREGGIAIFDQNHDGKLDVHAYGYGDDASQNPAGETGWFNDFMVNSSEMNSYTVPSAPTGSYTQENDDVVLSWSPSTDDITPSKAIRYNVYAKNKSTGSVFTLAPADIETGTLKYISHGAFLSTTTYTFKGLNADNYEFGVQAVNSGYLASEFTKLSFNSAVKNIRSIQDVTVRATGGILVIENTGSESVRYEVCTMNGIRISDGICAAGASVRVKAGSGVYVVKANTSFESVVNKVVL